MRIVFFIVGLFLSIFCGWRAWVLWVLASYKDPESAKFLRQESMREMQKGNSTLAALRQVQADDDEFGSPGVKWFAFLYTAGALIGVVITGFVVKVWLS